MKKAILKHIVRRHSVNQRKDGEITLSTKPKYSFCRRNN